jgi:hypothetical protein
MSLLEGWGNFYVIVGSSAGALIGLQFVAITLIANMRIARTDPQAGEAFSTPSVVHFVVALLLSAVGSAPWGGIGPVAALWGSAGLGGVIYVAVVARRMWTQTVYLTVFEDWLFHALLPLASYGLIAAAAVAVFSRPRPALFLVGAAALLLLLVGIHNAWDAVTYHIFVKGPEQRKAERDASAANDGKTVGPKKGSAAGGARPGDAPTETKERAAP